MNCCLWLFGKRVYSACEILACFDVISLMGYFLGGSLVSWLERNGGERYADRLRSISLPIGTAELKSALYRAFDKLQAPETVTNLPLIRKIPTGGEATSFNLYGALSSRRGKNGETPYSFAIPNSFRSSFNGSFTSSGIYGSFGSFPFEDILSGSFVPLDNPELSPEENRLVRIAVAECPLNLFGYGLHLI